ncbi:hypothetical protein V6N13_078751 [Hibiscus sabdariffa]
MNKSTSGKPSKWFNGKEQAQLDDMVAGTGTANLDKFFEDVENVLTEDMKSCREALQSIAISQQGMVQ